MGFRSDLAALALGALTDGAAHGYEIARRIRELSGNELIVGEGLLYPTLHSLERARLIEAQWVQQEGKPNRKVYRLTSGGHAALDNKRKEWQSFAAAVVAVLGSPHESALPEAM